MLAAEEEKEFLDTLLKDPEVAAHVSNRLHDSLPAIGFSSQLVSDLTTHLPFLDIPSFREEYRRELVEVYTTGFFQRIVPDYFLQNVVPHIPPVSFLLDIGCGTGILAHKLSQSGRFQSVIGVDLVAYPEWEPFSSASTRFFVVPEAEFPAFLGEHAPDAVVMTWTLHHMLFDEQERYIRMIRSALSENALLIVLEDSYAEAIPPEQGGDRAEEFFVLSKAQRQGAMSVFDWIANRVLAGRMAVKIPFAYRTLEEWEALFVSNGFSAIEKRFIGFPERRDIHTPQSLLILQCR